MIYRVHPYSCRYIKLFLTILIPLLCLTSMTGQVTGQTTDENGNPLGYVNIYVRGTSSGTTSNPDGKYILKLEPGDYEIVFQFVGYRTEVRHARLTDNQMAHISVQLQPETYELAEVTIVDQSEDPAYAIIRKAQAKRKYYKNRVRNWTCDVYVRGFNKILDAPDRIFGMDIGDMDGMLDSSRQGVVYLSESVSKLHYHNGNYKEVMYSSKISGDDRGYSFNSAREMNFDFYGNTVELNKRIITPIAGDAMSYYKYELEGATIDEYGQLVNKIKVIPKNEYAPCFYGYIYINENLWNISGLELGVTSKSTQLPFIDSLLFTQSFIPLQDDIWMPFSNVITFRMQALGFILRGTFAGVYSNYILEAENEDVFNNEVFIVEKEANERSKEYWDTLRPIPLTDEEQLDYERKDSIRILKSSPEYKDSVDREANRFGPFDILSGYTFQNSHKNTRIRYSSPLGHLSMNTVQGWNFSAGVEFRKAFDEDYNRTVTAGFKTGYGFSEQVWRPVVNIRYRANRINNLYFELGGGRERTQVNSRNPISERLNFIMSYLFRRNYLKLYDRRFLHFLAQRDIGNIFRFRIALDYEKRSPLDNHYDQSLFFRESRTFTPNIPDFEPHKATVFLTSLRIKIGEKVWKYPNRKFRAGSAWPTIWLHFRKTFRSGPGNPAHDLIHASIYDSFRAGALGETSAFLHGGTFLGSDPVYFIDHYHFMGNRTHIGYPPDYSTRFLMLPYYSHSASNKFLQLHFLHHFEGFVLNKIPLIRRTGWQLSAGYKLLKSDNFQVYDEFHVGLDNIGFRIFRLFRIDMVWARRSIFEPDRKGYKSGVVLGLKAEI